MIVAVIQYGYGQRWECECGTLLAMITSNGQIEIKLRDRWYYVDGGTVQAVCPKCGREQTMEVGNGKESR